MEENAVVMNGAPVDAGTDGAQSEQVVDATELLCDEESNEATLPRDERFESDADAPQETEPSREVDERQIAFGQEMQRVRNAERERYERALRTHPAMQVGMQIVEDISRTQGVPLEAAAQMARSTYIQAVARREGVSPMVAQALLTQQQQQQQQAPAQYDAAQHAAEIRAEVAHLHMPSGFDFERAVQDEGFVQLLTEMPVSRAIELYSTRVRADRAPQDMAERIRGRARIPQHGKTQQPVNAKVDYHNMSSEAFMTFKTNKHDAEAHGKKVRL